MMMMFGISEFSKHGISSIEGGGEIIGFHGPAHDVGGLLYALHDLVENVRFLEFVIGV